MGDFQKETEAYASLQRLMEEAQKTKALFVRAGLDIPAPLGRMFGDKKAASTEPNQALTVPPIEEPARPPGVEANWVWISIRDAITISLVKAIMGRAKTPMRPVDIAEQVQAIRPDLSRGGVYNTGRFLDNASLLNRGEDGAWELKAGAVAPVLNGKYLWGPPDALQKYELAAHRRELILHVLKVFKGGLQITQIVEMLARLDQCRAPLNKDLVKADMEILQDEKKVKRIGNSKKWVLAQED